MNDLELRGEYLLVACQAGAEDVVAARMTQALPGSTRGAWRRGVVTFRLPPGLDPSPADLDRVRDSVIVARTLFRCHGQIRWDDDAGRLAALRERLPAARFDAIHLFPRDLRALAAADVVADMPRHAAAAGLAAVFPEAKLGVASPGDLVLDCLSDGDDRWWIGWHRASSPSTCWPGGLHPRPLPGDKVSRAWLKLDEAIDTFGVEFREGQHACELGASPGGACQRLLESGLGVVGIDPALVDPVVAAIPGFTQWRKRARDVPLRDLRGFDWVVADMNIDPVSTLEAVGRVVTAPGSRTTGIIATLKIPDWSRADGLDGWLAQFRAWGFAARARQLSTGGREVCVVALRTGQRRNRQRSQAVERGTGKVRTSPPAKHRPDQ
jgi:23S rRNA (cytidine2498-2'-O)-methyltransferase